MVDHCPYCHALWQAVAPYLEKDVQVRHILLGVLTPTSEHKAARILAADDPVEALEAGFREGGIEPLKAIPTEIYHEVGDNNLLMSEVGGQATPVVFYRDRNGKVRRIIGMPAPCCTRRCCSSRSRALRLEAACYEGRE